MKIYNSDFKFFHLVINMVIYLLQCLLTCSKIIFHAILGQLKVTHFVLYLIGGVAIHVLHRYQVSLNSKGCDMTIGVR